MRAITRLVLGVLALVTVAACGGGDDGNGDTSGDRIALRPLALAYVAGAYDGRCAPLAGGTATPGTVELLPSGDLGAPGIAAPRGILLDRSMSYTIRRDLDGAGPTQIGLSIDDGTDGGVAVEMTTQQDDLVRVRQGARTERTGSSCTGVTTVERLRDTPLLPSVATLVTSPEPRPFDCTGPDGDARRTFATDTDGATLGDERWSFTTGLARERLYVGPVVDGDRLVYEVRLLDGRSLGVQVDDRGRIDYLLTRPSQDGAYTECRPA